MYIKKSLTFQLHPSFQVIPWYGVIREEQEDVVVFKHFLGWLLIQCRWSTIN